MAFPITGVYYLDQSVEALTNAYGKMTFPDRVRSIIIINDDAAGANTVIYSRDGTLQNGEVRAGESVTIRATVNRYITEMSFKFGTAAPNYRIMTLEG